MINLKQGERIDDLNRNGYKIIQSKDKFCFGMDAVSGEGPDLFPGRYSR